MTYSSAMAVGTDAAAVTALAAPSSQYIGYHSVSSASQCVTPQATMNVPNSMNIHDSGMSRRFRRK
jgi:hypothetical protein